MHANLFLIWIFVLSTSVYCKWWGRLIPPFLRRNRGNSRTRLSDDSEVTGAGLRNLGNTCYMNSVLQSLYYSIPYRQRVINSTFVEDSVGEKMSWLFEEMEGSGYVDTIQVARALNLNTGTQEDAQEFLLRLINEIDSSADSTNSSADSTDNDSNGSVGSGDGKMKEDAVSSVFSGLTEQIIQCTKINFSKCRQQRFLDLTVDIIGYDRLGAALKDMFTKPDYLTGANQYRVPKGTEGTEDTDRLQDAEKRLSITELPDMLCLTLKRFTFDASTSTMTKIGDVLEFPVELNMKPYYVPKINTNRPEIETNSSNDSIHQNNHDNQKNTDRMDYQLSSVVVHEGSAGFGHYICYARPDPKKKPEKWLKLNDQIVSETNFKEVCEVAFGSNKSEKFSRNAYLLFYSRNS